MQIVAVVLIAVLVVGIGWICAGLVQSGRLAARTGALVMLARVPVAVVLLGLVLGLSPREAVLLAALAGVGAVVGYRLMTSAVRRA